MPRAWALSLSGIKFGGGPLGASGLGGSSIKPTGFAGPQFHL